MRRDQRRMLHARIREIRGKTKRNGPGGIQLLSMVTRTRIEHYAKKLTRDKKERMSEGEVEGS